MSIEAEGRERHTFGTSRSKVTAADFSAVMDEVSSRALPSTVRENLLIYAGPKAYASWFDTRQP